MTTLIHDVRAALLDETAQALADDDSQSAAAALGQLFSSLEPGRPEDLTYQIFGQALARRAGREAPNVNLYLRDLHLRQISLFNLIATHLPFVSRCGRVANHVITGLLAGTDEATLLDVGIGTGQQEVAILRALAAQDRLPKRLHIVGIEPGPSMLADAERACAALRRELGLELTFTGVRAVAEALTEGDWAQLRDVVGADAIVNAAFAAHHIQSTGSGPREARDHVFRQLRALEPRAVTLVEPNSDHVEPDFLRRFRNCWEHFGTAMGAIDASPASSTDKLAMKMFFAREVDDIVANAEDTRAERHERTEAWVQRLDRTGFGLISALPAPEPELLMSVDAADGWVRLGHDGTPMVALLCAGRQSTDLASLGWTDTAGNGAHVAASVPELGGHGPAMLRVRDIMRPEPDSVRIGASLSHVASELARTGAADLVVLDDEGRFAGVVSEGDLIRAMLPSGTAFEDRVAEGFEVLAINGRARAADVIDDLVIRDPVTLEETDDLLRVARLMIDRQIRRLPVVADGRPTGTVSRADLAAALLVR